jgi:hypothetical protein
MEVGTKAAEAGMVKFAASSHNDSSDGGPTRANVDLPARYWFRWEVGDIDDGDRLEQQSWRFAKEEAGVSARCFKCPVGKPGRPMTPDVW